MPFDPSFDKIYEKLIKPPLEEVGYEVKRADDFTSRNNILQTIVVGIAQADLIIAEISVVNANVMYELGICHALDKPTIMICQSLDEIPFDLRSYKLEVYSTDFDEVDKLKDSIREAGEEHLKSSITFGNPVTDFWPKDIERSIWSKEIVLSVTAEDDILEVVMEEPEEEKGVLDYLFDGNEAMESIAETIGFIMKSMEEMTTALSSKSSAIDEVKSSDSPNSAMRMRRLAILAAADLTKHAQDIENKLPGYENDVQSFTESFDGISSLSPSKSEEDISNLRQLRGLLSTLSDSIDSGLEGLHSYMDSLPAMKGISKELNKASQRLHKGMSKFIENTELMQSACSRILNIIDGRLS